MHACITTESELSTIQTQAGISRNAVCILYKAHIDCQSVSFVEQREAVLGTDRAVRFQLPIRVYDRPMERLLECPA